MLIIPRQEDLMLTISLGQDGKHVQLDGIAMDLKVGEIYERYKDVESFAEQQASINAEFRAYFNGLEGAEAFGGINESQAQIILQQLDPALRELKKKRMPYLEQSPSTDTDSSKISSRTEGNDSTGHSTSPPVSTQPKNTNSGKPAKRSRAKDSSGSSTS